MDEIRFAIDNVVTALPTLAERVENARVSNVQNEIFVEKLDEISSGVYEIAEQLTNLNSTLCVMTDALVALANRDRRHGMIAKDKHPEPARAKRSKKRFLSDDENENEDE